MNNFNWRAYIKNYPDLAFIKDGAIAYRHYLQYGIREGRTDKWDKPVYPVIVAIAKFESRYIKEWVDYHLALGFEKIYLYDNEDTPVYEKLLNNPDVIVKHFPVKIGQYRALEDFMNYVNNNNVITHVIHIDLDEFIALKKHSSIQEFIADYFVDDCVGIGINWRFFGDSGHRFDNGEPVTQRFTMFERDGNKHVKTLFDVNYFSKFRNSHIITTTNPTKFIKSTNGTRITDNNGFNYDIDFSVIQLNHYKCKTLPEFKQIRTRGSPDIVLKQPEDVEANFNLYNRNEIEELTARDFYKSIS
jgi:hypothetical protein